MVSIDAKEFVSRVTSGESVEGVRITEPVVLGEHRSEPVVIRTARWRRCEFDYNVTLLSCEIAPDANGHHVLFADGCKFNGIVTLEHVVAAGNGDAELRLLFDHSEILSDFGLWNNYTGPLHCSLNSMRCAGNVSINEGRFTQTLSLDASDLSVVGNVHYSLPAPHYTDVTFIRANIQGSLRGTGIVRYVRAGNAQVDSVVALHSMDLADLVRLTRVFYDFTEARVGGTVDIESSGSQAITCHFSEARVDGRLRLMGALQGPEHEITVDLNGVHVTGDVQLHLAALHTPDASRGRLFELCNAKVTGSVIVIALPSAHDSAIPLNQRHVIEVAAWGAQVGGDFSIRSDEYLDVDRDSSQIQLRFLDLKAATIGRDIRLRRLQLRSMIIWSSGTACIGLQGVHANALKLEDVECDIGPFDALPWVVGDRNMQAWDGSGGLVRSMALIDLSAAKLQGELSFQSLSGTAMSVEGVEFSLMDLQNVTCHRLLLEDFHVQEGVSQTALPVRAGGVSVAADVVIRPQVRASGTHGEWTETEAAKVPIMDFSYANIGSLQLTDPPPLGRLDLRGASILRWNVQGRTEVEIENAETFLRLLGSMTKPDSSIYSSVENRLVEIGKPIDADKVLVARRRMEEQHLLQDRHWWYWLKSRLHDVFLAYGTKTWRPLFPIAFIFLLSCVLAYSQFGSWFQLPAERIAQMQECGELCSERLRNAHVTFESMRNADPGTTGSKWVHVAGFTTRNFVPVVDLGVGGGIEPIGGTGGSMLAVILKILGWILWPILISGAIVSLIHPRHRG